MKGSAIKKLLLIMVVSAVQIYSAQAGQPVLDPGPYRAGHRTWMLEDTTRGVPAYKNSRGSATRKLATEIWYPSDVSRPFSGRNAPLTASAGPFPLVVYSHGIMSERGEAAYLARYLATQGVVFVAFTAPATSLYNAGNLNFDDIVNIPGDVSFLIDEMLKRNADPSSPFFKKINESCIGAAGTSLGAGVSLMAGFKSGLRDPRISLVVTFAAGVFGENVFDTPEAAVPLLLVHGDLDAIIPYAANAPALLGAATGPAYLLTLIGGTHTGFSNAATSFFWTSNVDSIGCTALSFAGIDVCDLPLPAGMDPHLQHDLATLAAWNFIAMHFSADGEKRAQAADFLLNTMPKKYGGEITIQSNGK